MPESLFDGYGKYLYCSSCIGRVLGIHKAQLARLRYIKVSQCRQPIRRMTKKEVAEKKLQDFVLRPGLDTSPVGISVWWKRLKDTDDVEVKYPYERRRLAGWPSNKSKSAVRSAFLTFVDANSHPNGRQAGSYSPHFFFIPKFTRIDPQNPEKRTLIQRLPHSLYGPLITHKRRQVEARVLRLQLVSGCKRIDQKVVLHPHKSDYCDTCQYLKEEVSRQQL